MACLKPDIYEYYLIIFLPYGEGICEDISPTSSHGCSGSSSSSSSTSRNHPLCRAVQQRVSLADHRGGLWGEETLIASYSPHQEEVCSEMDLDISALLHPPTPTSTHTHIQRTTSLRVEIRKFPSNFLCQWNCVISTSCFSHNWMWLCLNLWVDFLRK